MSNQRNTKNHNGSKPQSDNFTVLVFEELKTDDGVEVAGGGARCRPWPFEALSQFFSLFRFPWGGGCRQDIAQRPGLHGGAGPGPCGFVHAGRWQYPFV